MTARCSVARIPDLGVSTYYDQSYPGTGSGVYAPDLATLEATYPAWSDVGFVATSPWEPLLFHSSLPAPWGAPSFDHGAVWQSDPTVQSFVTAKNWAGRWEWFPNFPGTVVSAELAIEYTDILDTVRFNDVAVTGAAIDPALVEHSGGAGNVVATYTRSIVLDPYSMVAWLLTLSVALVPGHWPLLRLTVPGGTTERLTIGA